jgi:hypothetical protein
MLVCIMLSIGFGEGQDRSNWFCTLCMENVPLVSGSVYNKCAVPWMDVAHGSVHSCIC